MEDLDEFYNALSRRGPPAALPEIVRILQAIPLPSAVDKDFGGLPPIFLALRNPQARNDVVVYLLENSPRSTLVRDRDNNLPLHVAISTGCSLDVIQTLAQSLCRRNDQEECCLPRGGRRNYSALHFAVAPYQSKTRSLEVIKYLLEIDTSAVKHKATGGNLPLHLALRFNDYNAMSETESTRDQIAKLLIDTYPAALRESPLPILHAAAFGNVSPETMQYMVQLYPGCLEVAPPQNHPLAVYCSSNIRGNQEILRFLLTSTPQEKLTDVDPRQLLMSLLKNLPETCSRSVPAISFLLEKWPVLACEKVHVPLLGKTNAELLPLHAILWQISYDLSVFTYRASTTTTEDPYGMIARSINRIVDAYPLALWVRLRHWYSRGLYPMELFRRYHYDDDRVKPIIAVLAERMRHHYPKILAPVLHQLPNEVLPLIGSFVV